MIRTITSCQITGLNMLFLPLRFQSTCLLKLSGLVPGTQDYNQQRPSQELVAKDLHGTDWMFRHIYRGSTTTEQTHSWFYLGSIATYLDMSLCTWYIPTPAHNIHFPVLSWCHGWTSYGFESFHLGFWVIIHRFRVDAVAAPASKLESFHLRFWVIIHRFLRERSLLHWARCVASCDCS